MPSDADQGFDPYYKWLGIPAVEQPPNHYRLLGIEKYESDVDVIESAADRQMSFLRQFATGPHGALSQRLLNEVSAARLVLLVEGKRLAYDDDLRRAEGLPTGASVELEIDEDAVLAPEDGTKPGDGEEALAGGPVRREPQNPDGETYSVRRGDARADEAAHKRTVAKLVEARRRIERLERQDRIEDAKSALRKVAAVSDPRLYQFAKWAREKLETIGVDPEEMRARADSLVDVGWQLVDRYDFQQAIQILEEIPPQYRSDEFHELLEEAKDLQEEVERLEAELREAVEEDEVDKALLPTIERLLKIKPVHHLARELYEALTGRSADRFVPKRKRRRNRRGPGLPGLPIGKLVVGAFVVLFVGLAGWGVLSVLREFAVEQSRLAELGRLKLNLSEALRTGLLEGGLTLTIDGKPIPPDQFDQEIPLEGGEHELVVSKGKKPIHTEKIVVPDRDVADVELTYEDGKIASVVAVSISDEPIDPSEGPPREVHVLGTTNPKSRAYPTRLSLSNNGRYLVSLDTGGTITLWDLASGSPVRKVRPGRRTYSFALAPNGATLASVADGNVISLFDLSSGRDAGKLEGHASPPTAMAYSPDGSTLVSFAGGGDRTVRLWDLESRKPRWSSPVDGTSLKGLSFSPDGKLLLAGVDEAAVLLDASTGEPLRKIDASWPARIATDGLVVGRSHGTTPLAWSTETGGEYGRLGKTPNDGTIAFSSDGRLVATPASADRRTQEVVVWEARAGRELTRLKGHERTVTCLAFTPDRSHLVSGSQDGTIRFWKLPAEQPGPLEPTPLADAGTFGETRRISFTGTGPSVSGDGRLVAVVQGGCGKVFDVESGALLLRTGAHDARLTQLSADGRYLVTAGKATLRVWDTDSGQLVHRVPVPGTIRSLHLSGDNQRVGCVLQLDRSEAGHVASVLEIATGREVHRRGLVATERSIAFSRDLDRLAIAFGAEVRVFGVGETEPLAEHVFLAPGDERTPVDGLTFTPDGRHVVVACADRTLRVWAVDEDVDRGTLRIGDGLVGLASADDASRVVVATDAVKVLDQVNSVANDPFSKLKLTPAHVSSVPGANSIVVSSIDETLHVLRLPDGPHGPAFADPVDAESTVLDPDAAEVGLVRRIEAHRAAVSDLRFTGNADDLASVAQGDRVLRMWNAATAESVNELETGESDMLRLACAPSLVVAGKTDGGFVEWNLATGKEAKWATKLDAPITSVDLSGDGSWLTATASDERKPAAQVVRLDTKTGQPVWTVQRGGRRAGSALLPNDQLLLAELDGTVTALDPENGNVSRWFDGDRLAGVSAEGEVVVTSQGDVVRVWNVRTGREIRQLVGFDRPPTRFALSPDGRGLATVDEQGTEIRLWDLPTGRQLAVLTGSRAEQVSCIAFDTKGRTIAFGERGGTIGLWIPDDRPYSGPLWFAQDAEDALPPGNGLVHTSWLTGDRAGALVIDPGGRSYGIVQGPVVKVFDVRSGVLQFKSPVHDRPVTSLAISRDGTTVVTATQTHLFTWERYSGSRRSTIRVDFPASVRVTPDGTVAIALCGGDGRRTKPHVAVFDLATGEELRRLADGKSDDYSGPALSPDGRTYAVFHGEAIRRFDVESGAELAVLRGHESTRRPLRIGPRIAFSPTGDRLFSFGRDATLRVWDTSTAEAVDAFAVPPSAIRVALSDSGRILAATNQGLELLVPEHDELEESKTQPKTPPMRSHGPLGVLPTSATGLAFVPGSPHALSTHEDGSLRVWGGEVPSVSETEPSED